MRGTLLVLYLKYNVWRRDREPNRQAAWSFTRGRCEKSRGGGEEAVCCQDAWGPLFLTNKGLLCYTASPLPSREGTRQNSPYSFPKNLSFQKLVVYSNIRPLWSYSGGEFTTTLNPKDNEPPAARLHNDPVI